jgi:hypothetical protein
MLPAPNRRWIIESWIGRSASGWLRDVVRVLAALRLDLRFGGAVVVEECGVATIAVLSQHAHLVLDNPGRGRKVVQGIVLPEHCLHGEAATRNRSSCMGRPIANRDADIKKPAMIWKFTISGYKRAISFAQFPHEVCRTRVGNGAQPSSPTSTHT